MTDDLAECNCECSNAHITFDEMGVEKCTTCGKLAGGDAFRMFGDELPTRRKARKRVHPQGER